MSHPTISSSVIPFSLPSVRFVTCGCLGLEPSNVGGMGSIPGWGTKIPHAVRPAKGQPCQLALLRRAVRMHISILSPSFTQVFFMKSPTQDRSWAGAAVISRERERPSRGPSWPRDSSFHLPSAGCSLPRAQAWTWGRVSWLCTHRGPGSLLNTQVL